MVTIIKSRRSEPAGEAHLPGEVGTWIFIFGDMTVFALLFGVYLQSRSQNTALFDAAQRELDVSLGALNTLLLLCSSLAVVTAIRMMRDGNREIARPAIATAFACGLGFIAVKVVEWGHHLGAGDTPATNDFWMYYFIITGLHLFHLLVGMGLLIFLFTQGPRPVTLGSSRFAFVEGAGCFWHMVDLLWVVIFPLIYLVK